MTEPSYVVNDEGYIIRLITTATLLVGLCESLNFQHHNDDHGIVSKPYQYMLPVNFKRVHQQNNNLASVVLAMAFIISTVGRKLNGIQYIWYDLNFIGKYSISSLS
jgi:hypothetical protein